MEISIVIPVFNEEESVKPLFQAIDKSLEKISYEVVFVDDGSNDKTIQNLENLSSSKIKIVSFSRNFGQTSAMAAGIEAAEGKYLAFLDGDLQNDPSDIPRMLKILKDEKLDLVAGRRAKRKDGFVLRKIPSYIANRLIYGISKIKVQDYGCTLKVMKTPLAKNLDLYGELHRFIPILASMNGAKIKEVDVKHHERQFGVSKYGLSRTFRVASDILLMAFFIKYRQKPMHLFGSLGLPILGVGILIEFYLLLEKIFGADIGGRPLFYVGILCIISGIQLITTGFIAELLMRTYFAASNKKPYNVKEVIKVKDSNKTQKTKAKKNTNKTSLKSKS